MRRAYRRATLAVVAGLLMAPYATAQGSGEGGSRSIETSWDCLAAILAIPVDADRVASYVPAPFTVQEIAGQALLGVVVEDCTTTVGGGEPFQHVLSVVIVKVNDPATSGAEAGADTDDFYDLLWGTSSPRYHAAAAPLGFATYIPKSRFGVNQVGDQLKVIEADVPWSESPFSVSVTTGEPPEANSESISVHWGLGRGGVVRTHYVHDVTRASGSIGTLRVTRGTLLAEILGAEEVTAPAVIERFTIERAVSEMVE